MPTPAFAPLDPRPTTQHPRPQHPSPPATAATTHLTSSSAHSTFFTITQTSIIHHRRHHSLDQLLRARRLGRVVLLVNHGHDLLPVPVLQRLVGDLRVLQWGGGRGRVQGEGGGKGRASRTRGCSTNDTFCNTTTTTITTSKEVVKWCDGSHDR